MEDGRLDQIENKHAARLQVENLNAVIAGFSRRRRCLYCGARFIDLDLYRRHVKRANRTGVCLGQRVSGPSDRPETEVRHSQHLYLVPKKRPHDMVEAVPRVKASMRAEFEVDDRYRVVGYEEAMDLAAQPGWIVSPCWCGGDGFSKTAKRHPAGAIGRKLGMGP